MWAAASRRSYSFSYSFGLHEFLLESTCQRSACAEADAASRLAGTDSKRREGVGSIPALRFPRRGTPWLKLKRRARAVPTWVSSFLKPTSGRIDRLAISPTAMLTGRSLAKSSCAFCASAPAWPSAASVAEAAASAAAAGMRMGEGSGFLGGWPPAGSSSPAGSCSGRGMSPRMGLRATCGSAGACASARSPDAAASAGVAISDGALVGE